MHNDEARAAWNKEKAAREENLDEVHEDIIFKHLILALPKAPLEKLLVPSADLFADSQQQIEEFLDSAYSFPLVKVFCVVKRRWWEEEPRANISATRIPTREIHYWKGKKTKKGLIMIYTDRPASTFWGNYVKSGPHRDVAWIHAEEDTFNQKLRLKKKLARYLQENERADLKEEDILWVGIRDWGRDPYGGNHAWRPKRRYPVVMRKLGKCTMTEGVKGSIHICGEAYSDYHGFMEGALRSAVFALSFLDEGYSGSSGWLGKFLLGEGSDCADDQKYFESMITWIKDLKAIGEEEDVYGFKAIQHAVGSSSVAATNFTINLGGQGLGGLTLEQAIDLLNRIKSNEPK